VVVAIAAARGGPEAACAPVVKPCAPTLEL